MKSLLMFIFALIPFAAQAEFTSERHNFSANILSDDLKKPWAMAFLPDGDFLITEHAGQLVRLSNTGVKTPIPGLPKVVQTGQGGLLDVALDPDFESNQRIFLCYAGGSARKSSTDLASARLVDDRLTDVQILLESEPRSSGGRHFGCRIAFDEEKRLYFSIGDRGDRPNAQNQTNHAGGVMRVNRDGKTPLDNPFVGQTGIREEIFSYGNRNPQGMARHPQTGEIWAHEHGPKGGDELNIIRAGVNYGWPTITYGKNYVLGTSIGEGTEKAGVAQPQYYWVPSIAPSGMAFYTGDVFPEWQGNLFIGSLKFQLLVRLELDGDQVVHEERMLEEEFGRIRDVRQGPDGLIYLLTDATPGKLIQLKPD